MEGSFQQTKYIIKSRKLYFIIVSKRSENAAICFNSSVQIPPSFVQHAQEKAFDVWLRAVVGSF